MAIDPEVFFDNDADLLVEDLPTGLVVEWFLGATETASTPVGGCSGTLTEGVDGDLNVIYEGVLQGSDITDDLTPGTKYYYIVKVGQDLRVYGETTCRAARLANA